MNSVYYPAVDYQDVPRTPLAEIDPNTYVLASPSLKRKEKKAEKKVQAHANKAGVSRTKVLSVTDKMGN